MMSQKQQRILMRSSLAMGVTVAVGMLAFGQVTGAPVTGISPVAATSPVAAAAPTEYALGDPAVQVAGVAPSQSDLMVTETTPVPIASEGPAFQSQELSRIARDNDDDDDDEHEEHRESPRISERRDRR